MPGAAENEDVRGLLLSWNRACASGDIDRLAALSSADVVVCFEGREYRGREGLGRFADSLTGGGVAARMHATHHRMQPSDASVVVHSFAMIVQHASAAAHADGSPWPTWLGWSEDTVAQAEGGPVIERRDFHAWTTEAAAGFGIEEVEPT